MIDQAKIEVWKNTLRVLERGRWEVVSRQAGERATTEYTLTWEENGPEDAIDVSVFGLEPIRALLADREEMLSVLREVGWSSRDHVGRRCCPVCGGYRPEGDTDREPGHEPGCRLAALPGVRAAENPDRVCGVCGAGGIPRVLNWPWWRDGKPVHVGCVAPATGPLNAGPKP